MDRRHSFLVPPLSPQPTLSTLDSLGITSIARGRLRSGSASRVEDPRWVLPVESAVM
jgi:hypothetical protein